MSMSLLLRVLTMYTLGIVLLMFLRNSPGLYPWGSSSQTRTVALCGITTTFTVWAACAATAAQVWPCTGGAPGPGGPPLRISLWIFVMLASIWLSWALVFFSWVV